MEALINASVLFTNATFTAILAIPSKSGTLLFLTRWHGQQSSAVVMKRASSTKDTSCF